MDLYSAQQRCKVFKEVFFYKNVRMFWKTQTMFYPGNYVFSTTILFSYIITPYILSLKQTDFAQRQA